MLLTVQLSFLSYLLLKLDEKGPHLIVVPASSKENRFSSSFLALSNWEREVNECCPQLNALLYYGSFPVSDRTSIYP